MSHPIFDTAITVFVSAFGLYALIKFAFFFVLSYAARRKLLDKAYAGRAYATSGSDIALLVIAIAMSIALLVRSAEPITFLGGLLAGGTLIQLYFHAFHAPVSREHDAPEPRSPLKIMSYAIQSAPWRPWKELLTYAALVVACMSLYWLG